MQNRRQFSLPAFTAFLPVYRAFKFFYSLFGLLFLILGMTYLYLGPTSMVYGQATNEEIYNQKSLVIAGPIAKEKKVKELDGLLTHEIKSKILTDSSKGQVKIEFYIEIIKYEPLGKGNFARFLQGSVNLVDTVEHPKEWTYRDTLKGKELSRIRRTKVEQLKGSNPRLVNKLVIPLIGVVASVGAVVALFYVRTQ